MNNAICYNQYPYTARGFVCQKVLSFSSHFLIQLGGLLRSHPPNGDSETQEALILWILQVPAALTSSTGWREGAVEEVGWGRWAEG